MRQKELRIALICYGGISLAVYMHGVTKEIWRATRASRGFLRGEPPTAGVEAVYRRLLEDIAATRGLKVRVLTDVVAGASAGGINGVFLAQAIASGQSLEPLTRMWLEQADIDVLLDPDARPFSRFTKFWAQPLVWFALKRPGNVVSSTVAKGTRGEVRRKLSRLIRARWFAPPFSGIGFSRLLADALEAMATEQGDSAPLLPDGHPLDLLVTATDFNGHLQSLRLNSPARVDESEHRLPIGFRHAASRSLPGDMADPLELVFAARATASFPGAFPPLTVAEIDRLGIERGLAWPGRDRFLARIMPAHAAKKALAQVALVDGSVLVNAPFAQAIKVLRDRPAQREVDRRLVYIDPRPDRSRIDARQGRSVGFFAAIFGSLSSIPREQPIRDNLEFLATQSRERGKLSGIVEALRPEVEEAVEQVFGYTLFLDKPTARRLTGWRAKAQQAAAERSGFAFHGYAQIKVAGIVESLAGLIVSAAQEIGPEMAGDQAEALIARIWEHLRSIGLDRLTSLRGGAGAETVAFLRAHDLGFRVRRLRLLARRLSRDWGDLDAEAEAARESARATVFEALALYLRLEPVSSLGDDFADLARAARVDPGPALAAIAARRDLAALDLRVDALLAEALGRMPKSLRRRALLGYLGFPFYDVATLPLHNGEGLNEFDPVKVDRISPEDCASIRPGGTKAALRGVEFFSFGAFFSRAYRENDYLWGRLHGAERMIDLIASTVEDPLDQAALRGIKRDAFLAILAEEETTLTTDPLLVTGIRDELPSA